MDPILLLVPQLCMSLAECVFFHGSSLEVCQLAYERRTFQWYPDATIITGFQDGPKLLSHKCMFIYIQRYIYTHTPVYMREWSRNCQAIGVVLQGFLILRLETTQFSVANAVQVSVSELDHWQKHDVSTKERLLFAFQQRFWKFEYKKYVHRTPYIHISVCMIQCNYHSDCQCLKGLHGESTNRITILITIIVIIIIIIADILGE